MAAPGSPLSGDDVDGYTVTGQGPGPISVSGNKGTETDVDSAIDVAVDELPG